MAFTASVLAVACSHCLADTVKGGELSDMALALQRERTAYRALLMLAGAGQADPEPKLARLVRRCIAMAFTASVPADLSCHRPTDERRQAYVHHTAVGTYILYCVVVHHSSACAHMSR